MVIYNFLTSTVIIGSLLLFLDPCYAMTAGGQDDFQKPKTIGTALSQESISPNDGEAWHSTEEELKTLVKLQRTRSTLNIFSSSQTQERNAEPTRSSSPPLVVNRNESFKVALKFFSSLSSQAAKNNIKPTLKKRAQTNQPSKKETPRLLMLPSLKIKFPAKVWDEPDWDDDDDDTTEPKRFSTNTLERAENIQEQLAMGGSISHILAQSENWFARNHGLYTQAVLLSALGKKGIPDEYKQKALNNPGLAKELMLKAHEAGFPSATFDLLKQAIQEKKMEEANCLLLTTCKNLITHSKELDSQNVERLVKDIQTLVMKNPELQNDFNVFKTDPLFQQTSTEKPKMNEDLKKRYGEEDKTLQDTIEELFTKELRRDDDEE